MFDVVWVGWVYEGSHDKLWGVLKSTQVEGVFYNFWGRRGKKPQFGKEAPGDLPGLL